MAYNLITRTEYKTYAGIKSNNYDAEIDALLPRVSLLVKNYCGRTFVDYMDISTPKTEYFDGGVKQFILDETPIVTINSFQYSVDYGQTWNNLVKYTDWVDNDDKLISILYPTFPYYLKGYKVVYNAGYVDVPADLALAVMDLMSYYRQNDMSIHSTKAPGTNNVQIEYISTTSLPAHIRRVLDMYRADYT